ncbi:hypothetical protein ACHWQZ_G002555 [Mnemiopsis leidyi]
MQAVPDYVESKDCAVLRETLKSLEISIQRNTDLLNEFWAKPPVPDTHNFSNEVNGSFFCQPDKIKSEKWYRNILKQLRGGRNVDAVFRQLMIVCQSYGFSLPPPPTKDTTLRSTAALQPGSLEVHELISQIYTRLAKHYCEVLQTSTNQYDTISILTALSYVISPTMLLAQFHSVRLTQINAQLPVINASSDFLVFYTRIQALISLTQEMAVADMGIFLTGIFNQIAEPNKIIRIVYLDRLSKELTASLQQLKSTNQLGTYFCDIVSQSYTLEQHIEYFLHKFAGLSLLEVVKSEETEAEQSSELLWNWRVSVFAPYLELFTERVALEKQELITHLGEIAPDFWQLTPCKGECVFQCKQYKCGVSLGVHSVLCRLVKYSNVVKQLGDIAELIVPQVTEDTGSESNHESLSDAVNSLSNEVVEAVLSLAKQLMEKVPETRPLVDLYVCYGTLWALDSIPCLPLSPQTRTNLQHTMSQILDQVCFVNNNNIMEWVLYEESAMCWTRNHTNEIKECNASLISLNLYLRTLYRDLQLSLPPESAHQVLVEVLEKSLSFVTNRYLAARPSKTNTKLYLYDVTAIVMIYSTYVWLLTGKDVTQMTEPREGPLMVIYSNLNRLLAAMSVITSPLTSVVETIKSFDRVNRNSRSQLNARPESDGSGSGTGDSGPVLPHSHAPAPSSTPVSWLPSIWISSLFTIDNLDTTLIYILRCFNQKHPSNKDLLLTALSNGARIPQQIQLYHNRETSQFDYNTIVLTMSRLLCSSKYDTSSWASFILSTFIPNEIWNCVSKPNFKFSRPGESEDLWQECIGEALVPTLEPILHEVLNLIVYRTKIMPSTDEEVAIEELPCSCRINRFSTPSLKLLLHESLSAIFTHLTLIAPSLKTSVVKLAKMLCVKAKLKEDSEIPVLKLFVAFFLKRMFMNPNEVNKKYHTATRDPVDGYRTFSTKLPFVDIPEESLSILKKVGDITRLIIMKDVLNVITLPTGAEKYFEEENQLVDHALSSLHEQLTFTLHLSSSLNSVQLDYDLELISSTYPGIFNDFHMMMDEITDIISNDYSSILRTVKLLPVRNLDPLFEYKSFGCFSLEDVPSKIWNHERLSEYYTTDLFVRYLTHRWELSTEGTLPDEVAELVKIIRAFLSKHSL